MDDLYQNMYGTHNLAAVEGVYQAGEKIASEYGDEGVKLFEQWLGQIPASDIFDTELNPEKTASDLGAEKLAELQQLDNAGRVIFHAFKDEQAKYDKIASYVGERVFERFVAEHTEG